MEVANADSAAVSHTRDQIEVSPRALSSPGPPLTKIYGPVNIFGNNTTLHQGDNVSTSNDAEKEIRGILCKV